jgi:lipopolysaccharide/colanic/teichoic acid biosynthesis glycosyltransferase
VIGGGMSDHQLTYEIRNYRVFMSPYLNHPLKRAVDILFSLLLLPVVIPVFLVICLMVLLLDGQPVFFSHKRVGKDGKLFDLIKIRTLKHSFNSAPGAQHQQQDVTSLGKFLRKTRIDEIPQIWTILKGEMSWVGPRPEVIYYYEHYIDKDPHYARRQVAKPGITGLAQLNDPNASPDQNLEKLIFDLKYVDHASFNMDLRILINSFIVIWKS